MKSYLFLMCLHSCAVTVMVKKMMLHAETNKNYRIMFDQILNIER